MSPLTYQWDGESMVLLPRHRRQADQAFTIGEHYTLVEVKDRSPASHRHYFAMIKDAFASMPDHMAGRWANAEHLRKEALIRKGFCDTRTFAASSNAEAARIVAFLRPKDSFAVYQITGRVITEYTAWSQDYASMDRETFQRSKDAVIDYLAEALGVESAALAKQAEPA